MTAKLSLACSCLLAASVLLLTPSTADAFSFVHHRGSTRSVHAAAPGRCWGRRQKETGGRIGFKRNRRKNSPSSLDAIVYAPDWEQDGDGASSSSGSAATKAGNSNGGPYVVEYTGLDDRTAEGSTTQPYRPDFSLLNDDAGAAVRADDLSERITRTHVQGLAHLVVAFSPQKGLRLEDVYEVRVANLDPAGRGVELQAVVRTGDEGGYVAVYVPLEFPRPPAAAAWSTVDEMEEFVMENLRLLEGAAAARIREMEWFERHRTVVHELQKGSVRDSTNRVDWWTDASPNLATACSSMLSMLQEDDLAGEVHALAVQQLDEMMLERSNDASKNSALLEVEHATVVAIGSGGIMLRAQTRELNMSPTVSESTDDDERMAVRGQEIKLSNNDGAAAATATEKEMDMVDIPVRFLRVVDNAEDLQKEILDLTDRASDYSHDDFLREQQQIAAAAIQEIVPVSESIETESPDEEEEKEQQTSSGPAAELQVEPAPKQVTVLPEDGTGTATMQPLPNKDKDLAEEEAALAARYAAIPDLGDRAYQILLDLGMI